MGKRTIRDTLPHLDLEQVQWVSSEESMRGLASKSGVPFDRSLKTFGEVLQSLQEKGAAVVSTNVADLTIYPVRGKFEGCLGVVRQSGVNVRRFLISQDTYEEMGGFQGCIDHLLSHNFVDCEAEVAQLRDIFEVAKIDLNAPLGNTDLKASPGLDAANRLMVDLIAAAQLLQLFEDEFGEKPDCDFGFALGFSVGRLFSNIQNMSTLEEKALMGESYAESYRARGRMGRSSERKVKRAEMLLAKIEELYRKNPDFKRMKPEMVANIAIDDCAADDPRLWSQGKAQAENYLTLLASDPSFKPRFDAILRKSG